MKVSEWKLENAVTIDDENIVFLSEIELVTKNPLVKGAKFIDAIFDDKYSPLDGATIYFMDTELGLFEITEDPEWDESLEVAIQNFKVKLKN